MIRQCAIFGASGDLASRYLLPAAAALDVAPTTVKRDWALARAWLHREMRGQPV